MSHKQEGLLPSIDKETVSEKLYPAQSHTRNKRQIQDPTTVLKASSPGLWYPTMRFYPQNLSHYNMGLLDHVILAVLYEGLSAENCNECNKKKKIQVRKYKSKFQNLFSDFIMK
jgi:hypothetical protein